MFSFIELRWCYHGRICMTKGERHIPYNQTICQRKMILISSAYDITYTSLTLHLPLSDGDRLTTWLLLAVNDAAHRLDRNLQYVDVDVEVKCVCVCIVLILIPMYLCTIAPQVAIECDRYILQSRFLIHWLAVNVQYQAVGYRPWICRWGVC